MLRSVKIKNLKGISGCEIPNLSQINLFLGKNNSGKSTVLEAIEYGLHEFSTKPNLMTILKHRGNVSSGGKELWYNYELTNTISNDYKFDEQTLQLNLSIDQSTDEISSKLKILDHDNMISANFDGSKYSSETGVTRNIFVTNYTAKKVLHPNVFSFVEFISYLDNSQRSIISDTEGILGFLKSMGKAKQFGEYLQEIYGIGQNWEFLPALDNPKEFRAAVIINEKPYFLTGLGDGIRYTMPILATAYSIKNSALLIEEIECNQHPGSLKKLIKILVKLCLQNNMQLFITSHSLDVAETLYYDAFDSDEQRNQKLRTYLLERNVDNGIVKCDIVKTEESDEDYRRVLATLLS